jgi:hypothetical protein
MPRKKRGNIARSDIMHIDTDKGRVLFKVDAHDNGIYLRIELKNSMYQGLYDVTLMTHYSCGYGYNIRPVAYGCSAREIKLPKNVQSVIHGFADGCFKPGVLFNDRMLHNGSKHFNGSCSLIGYQLPMNIKIILDDEVAKHLRSKMTGDIPERSLRRIVAEAKYRTITGEPELVIESYSLPYLDNEVLEHDYATISAWSNNVIREMIEKNGYNIEVKEA